MAQQAFWTEEQITVEIVDGDPTRDREVTIAYFDPTAETLDGRKGISVRRTVGRYHLLPLDQVGVEKSQWEYFHWPSGEWKVDENAVGASLLAAEQARMSQRRQKADSLLDAMF